MSKNMEYYGARFLTLAQFVAAAKSVGVETDEGELQVLEDEGLLFPVRRILKPKEFAEYFYRLNHDPDHPFYGKDRYEYDDSWDALHNLLQRDLPLFHAPGEKEHVHPLDREAMLSSGFVIRPGPENARPWSDYKFKVRIRDGREHTVDRAENYYAYWQVHDLYGIHQMVTVRLRIRPSRGPRPSFIHERVTAGSVYGQSLAIRGPRASGDFLGADKMFDAVGQYMAASSMAQRDAINARKDRTGCWMEKDLARQVNEQAAQAAKKIVADLKYDEAQVRQALRTLADQFLEYASAEKARLANVMRSDIRFALRMISDATAQDYNAVYSRYANLCLLNEVFTDEDGDARKTAIRELRGCVTSFNAAYAPHVLTQEDCEAFVAYCTGDLESIPWAISSLNKAYFRQGHRRERELFGGLGQLASGLEALVKTMLRPRSLISSPNLTFRPALRAVLGGQAIFDAVDTGSAPLWLAHAQFDARDGVNGFVTKYTALRDAGRVGSVTQSSVDLLLTGLMRNYTSHESALPPEDFFHNDFVAPFQSAMRALLYVWLVAKSKNLVP